jgi:pilus assembly protein Flp/PilA
VGLTALAAARSELNPKRAAAAEGHSQAWPSHHESVRNPRELSFDAEEGERIMSNQQTKGAPKMISKFFRDETGLELSEYAVAAALVAIAVVGAFTALGGAISNKINTLAATITG